MVVLRACWFSCGEGTQIQLLRSESCRVARLQRLLITHLHGDHIFGIPGLMCTLANSVQRPEFCLHLYGPAGLRKFVRNALRCSHSGLTYKYSVHELISDENDADLDHDYHPDEIPGGDIRPDARGIYHVLHSDHIVVSAPFIEHRIPSLGYVLQEDKVPGKLLIEKIQPILKQHEKEFAEKLGISNPMTLLAKFKSGSPISLPDGRVLFPEPFLSPPKAARKIVILGDTSDPSNIAFIAANADLLVHEATNAYLKQDYQTTTAAAVRELCISHGHSTPEMAGEFARRIGARLLVLNHFSSRYRGDDSQESRDVMKEIKQLAIGAFGRDQVLTAYDLQTIEIHRYDPST